MVLGQKNHLGCIKLSFLLCSIVAVSSATRTRVGPPQEDPPTSQAYNDLRHLRAHPNYYYLAQARLPVSDEPANRVFLRGNTLRDPVDFERNHFKFNSSEFIRRIQTHKWFMSLDERVAMHVYDDPRERDSAAGPQVDQELCGVHLDYMVHMMHKHHKHITKITDLSLFKILNSFDTPHQGLAEGNSVFPGSYDGCIDSGLNVIRDELIEMFAGNEQQASRYFTRTQSTQNERHRQNRSALALGILREFAGLDLNFLSTLVGFFSDDPVSSRPMDASATERLKIVGLRYCMAGMRWPSWSNSSWSKRHMTMRVATCLPETCDSNSLNLHQSQVMRLMNQQMTGLHSGFYLENLFCLPDESSEFRNPFNFRGSRLMMAFTGSWLALVILASMICSSSSRDQPREEGPCSVLCNFLKFWSVPRNLAEFLSDEQAVVHKKRRSQEEPPSSNGGAPNNEPESRGHKRREALVPAKRLDFGSLEGLKVLGSISVMTSHAVMLLATATKAPITFENYWHSWISIIATLCPSVVDVFFVTTGAMTVRSIATITREHSASVGFWIRYIIYRYLRIVPLYLLIHLFLQHLFRFIGSGPFWDYGSSHSGWSRGCQDESVWRVLLPSANFVSPSVHCNGVGWYLANDMQFTLLVPLLVPLLLKRPRLGHSLIAIACTLGTVAHVKYFWDHDPDPRGLLEWTSLTLTRITDDTAAGYIQPQYRFVAYFVGLSLGHLLVLYESNAIKRWPKWLLVGGKCYFYANLYLLSVLPFVSSLVLDWNETSLRWLSSIIPAVSHLTSSVAIAMLIIAITSANFNSLLTRIFASKLMRLLASMAHSTVLVHLPLMFYHQQSIRALPNLVTKYDMFKTTLVWELEIFALSFVVHILFEIPLRKSLIKMLLVASSLSTRKTPGANAGEKKKSN